MTRTLESTIGDRYRPKSTPKVVYSIEVKGLLDEAFRSTLSMVERLTESDFAQSPQDPQADPKKLLAVQISQALNHVADKTDPVNVQYLLAALVLLQLSSGDDPLMSVARRLGVKGMTPSVKKKIKEETAPINELSKETLDKYLDDNYADRKAMVGDKFDRPKIGKKFDKRMAGATLASQKLKKPVTESAEINYKHKAIDDAHDVWKSQIDHANKIADEMGHGKTPEHVKGSKEQIDKVKAFVDKHPHNRVPNALKMADHAGISDGLAAHFHAALKAVTESGMAKEKPFTQSDRIGRYLSDQRGRPRR